MKLLLQKATCAILPQGLALVLAHLGRLYIRNAHLHCLKASIARGRSVYRICNWHRLDMIASTEFGTRHRVRFPDMIQRYLFYFGVWEPAITAFIRRSLSAGDTFIDVGANIGYYTCLAAKTVGPTGTVYAIEASPSIYEALLQNVKLNDLKNVCPFNHAVLDRTENISLFKWSEANIGKTNLMELHPGGTVESVDARPLWEIVGWPALCNARLIKIDVEGAEWSVIKGIRERMHCFGPMTEWVIEINPSVMQKYGWDVNEFIAVFVRAGYRMYVLENQYKAEWYVRQRHLYTEASVDDLVDVGPSEVRSEIVALFTRRSYQKNLDRALAWDAPATPERSWRRLQPAWGERGAIDSVLSLRVHDPGRAHDHDH